MKTLCDVIFRLLIASAFLIIYFLINEKQTEALKTSTEFTNTLTEVVQQLDAAKMDIFEIEKEQDAMRETIAGLKKDARLYFRWPTNRSGGITYTNEAIW
jgi:hypothetical protein